MFQISVIDQWDEGECDLIGLTDEDKRGLRNLLELFVFELEEEV